VTKSLLHNKRNFILSDILAKPISTNGITRNRFHKRRHALDTVTVKYMTFCKLQT